jgi:hypothetical protein
MTTWAEMISGFSVDMLKPMADTDRARELAEALRHDASPDTVGRAIVALETMAAYIDALEKK